MSASELLIKAVEYDREGRKLECIKLYEEGIALLLQQCKLERDPDKKRHFHMKLNQYMTQAEKIKESIRQRGTQGVIKDKIHIIDGARNFSYATIFGKYLDDDVREVAIEEPYLSQHFQMCNLVMFCELLVSKCRNLHFIKVTTKKDDASNADQAKWFQSVTESLAKHNVCLQYELVDSIHDRQVLLSNGHIIKIGRGLHYFKPTPNRLCLGSTDFNFRECRETNVDIFYCPENFKG